MRKSDYLLMAILFVIGFWLWTLPISENNLPFGEGDAAYHFAVGDYATFSDHSLGIRGLPQYIGYWYYGNNAWMGPFTIMYPPSYHLDYSLMQIFGGERIIPPHVFIVITSFLAVLTMYLLVRKTYGQTAAVLVSVWLLFDIRSIMAYLWGQRPVILSFALIPAVIYSFYKYTDSYYKGEHKTIYLYIFALCFSSAYLIHLQSIIFIVFAILIFTALLRLKEGRFPISRKNFKHVVLAFLIILLICLPFIFVYFGAGHTGAGQGFGSLGDLFRWFPVPDNNFNLNPSFFEFEPMYISYWMVPLLLFGAGYLCIRKRRKDLLLLSLIIALYAIFHLHVLGITGISARIARYRIVEGYFFLLLIVLGAFMLADIMKKYFGIKNLRLVFSAALLIIVLFSQASQTYATLNSAYTSVLRITPAQYQASEWMRGNLPENAIVQNFGTLTYPKMRFMQILSHHYFEWNKPYTGTAEINVLHRTEPNFNVSVDYLVFDYSDLLAIRDQGRLSEMKNIEEDAAHGMELVYNRGEIRIFEAIE